MRRKRTSFSQFYYSFGILLALCLIFEWHTVAEAKADYRPVSDEKAADYLQQFGYASPAQIQERGSGGMAADLADVFTTAVRKFQEFAGLPTTGILDVRTKKKMAEPRCGLQDVQMLSTGKVFFKWKRNTVTYRIIDYSRGSLSRSQQKEAVRKALDAWSAVSPLNFKEITSGTADIKIRFARKDHGDAWPFDGRGGVLAHATMPTSGMLHFDDDENWVLMDTAKIAQGGYMDLLPVAIHESGHALGLSHSRVETAIMAPFYQESVDASGRYIYPELKPDDIQAIQEIYGPRREPIQKHQEGSGEGGGSSSSSSGSKTAEKLLKTAKNAVKSFMNWLDQHRKR